MSLALLRKQQMIALMIIAFLTLVIITFTLLYTVAHINVWHLVWQIIPAAAYHG